MKKLNSIPLKICLAILLSMAFLFGCKKTDTPPVPPPASPMEVQVRVGEDTCQISWTKPEGATTATRYNVKIGDSIVAKDISNTFFVVRKLTSDSAYKGQIIAGTVVVDFDFHTAPVAGPVEIYSNVRVIDSNVLILNKDQALINAGTYSYTFTGTPPNIISNDVIVGATGEGYIRKVTAVTVSGNTITLKTTPGTMSDVFKNGKITYSVNMADMKRQFRPTGDAGIIHELGDIVLYEKPNLSIKIKGGKIELNPNWTFDYRFGYGNLTYFEFGSRGGKLNAEATLDVTCMGSVDLVNTDKVLATYNKRVVIVVPVAGIPVPIVTTMQFDLVGQFSANVSASMNRSATFTSNNTFDLGAQYVGGKWNDIYGFKPVNTVTLNPFTGTVGTTVKLNIIPKVDIRVMGVAGPNASLGLMNELNANVAAPSGDWDLNYDVWLKATLGIKADFLGDNLLDREGEWETDKFNYKVPAKVAIVSGNGQRGDPGKMLPNPLTVVVKDSRGNTQANVPVYFNVTGGGGKLSLATSITDANGKAQTYWTLGNNEDAQTAEAVVKTAAGENIEGAPIKFTTTTLTSCGILKDIDGNEYHTVEIKGRCWMVENLKTSKYNDGSPISTDPGTYQYGGPVNYNPSYVYYNNDPSKNNIYGKLYNGLAIKTGKLAPKGWHIPSYDELLELHYYQTKDINANGTLNTYGLAAASNLWLGYNTNMDPRYFSANSPTINNSGFSALPGGWAEHYGVQHSSATIDTLTFYGIGSYAVFGSRTMYYSQNNNSMAEKLYILGLFSGSSEGPTTSTRGFGAYINTCNYTSVRCVKD